MDQDVKLTQDIRIKQLVRLLVMPPCPQLQPPLKQRAIYWAFQECEAAGVGEFARRAISIQLGEDAKARGEPPRYVPQVPEEMAEALAPAVAPDDHCICAHRPDQHNGDGCMIFMEYGPCACTAYEAASAYDEGA